MPDTTPKRKKRQKATTELGRQMLQKERQRLAKEQAELGERLANEAAAAREAKFHRPTTRAPKQQVIINRSIVRRCAGLLASENVVVPIRAVAAERDEQMKAWTDFDQIVVKFKQHDDVRLLAATLRALILHEGGHCRWSVPFLDLVEMVRERLGYVPTPNSVDPKRMHKAWNCLEDQRMETAVVSDAPRKASFFTPLIMTEHMKTLDFMAANYPLFVWRKYLPDRLVNEARRLFIVRHGAEGERLVRDLDRVTTQYVLATDPVVMWEAVCEYHGLLQNMQPLAVNMDDAGHTFQKAKKIREDDEFDGLTIPVDPSMIPPATDDGWGMDGDDVEVDEPNDLDGLSDDDVFHIMEILAASMLSPETLVSIRYVVTPQAPEASEEPEQGEDGEQGEGTPGDLADEDEDDSDGQEGTDGDAQKPGTDEDESDDGVPNHGRTAADESEDSDADDDTEGADEGDEGGEDDDKDHESHEGGATGSHTDDGSHLDDPMTQDDLDQIIKEAEDERYEQPELDGDVESFRNATEDMQSNLDSYAGGISSNTDAIAEAEALAQGIEDAFHAHTMDKAPAWVEEQRRGVLNVGRYATRQPGDTEFFRQWTEDDAPGFDMAVSILLDYSQSMDHHAERLAQMAYACKLACQKLDIPCTVVLWDTDARTLWDSKEPADNMPVIDCVGGTNPSVALTDLDNHRGEASKHLVLIMTDGQWQGDWHYGKRTLAWYKDPGRVLIGFGFGSDYLAKGLIGKGCDEAFAIDDLMEIPSRLEDALIDMVD